MPCDFRMIVSLADMGEQDMLGLSIVLMGFAASFIARLLNRHRWIAYVGLAIILYVAIDMIWRGFLEVQPHLFG